LVQAAYLAFVTAPPFVVAQADRGPSPSAGIRPADGGTVAAPRRGIEINETNRRSRVLDCRCNVRRFVSGKNLFLFFYIFFPKAEKGEGV
jgi:hypothetical protein